MKKILKYMVALVLLVSTVSTLCLSTLALEELDSNYEYEYYAKFDFEKYGNASDHLVYMRADTAKNADNTLCDPFDYMSTWGIADGVGTITEEENGNQYYSIKRAGTSDYAVMAVFSDKNSTIVGDAVELSFRFRMQSEQTMSASARMPLVTVRRSTSPAGHYLYSDVNGNLYINKAGTTTLVYTNTDPEAFMDISFRWYDVTNTFSVYLNGNPLAEGIPFVNDLRSVYDDTYNTADGTANYVIQTYNDDFEVASRKIKATSDSHYRAIELIRSSAAGEKFNFDIDDIVLARLETNQGGAYYYNNSFNGVVDGVEEILYRGAYVYNADPTGKIYRKTDENNKTLYISNGFYLGLNDSVYQQFTQDSLAVSFKVKATAKHTEGFKSIAAVVDNKTTASTNIFEMLYVKPDGSLYLEKDDSTLIGGYKLDGENWLDLTLILTKNKSNAGKFGTINGTYSSSNNTMYVSCYINGEYVGSTEAVTYFEWRSDIGKAYSNHDITVTKNITDTLNLDGLTLVADGVNGSTSTANHKIYKSSDGLTYYDVEYAADKETQVKHHIMKLTYKSGCDEGLRIFYGQCFEGEIDDLKVYAGILPEENTCSENGSELVNVNFGKLAMTSAPFNATNGKNGSELMGTAYATSLKNTNVARKTAEGNAVTAENVLQADYASLTLSGLLDFFLPAPTANADRLEYSFETEIKNLNITKGNTNHSGMLRLFAQRLEDDSTAFCEALITVDVENRLWGGEYTDQGVDNRFALCDKNGNQIVLSNDSWNNLRADVFCRAGNSYVSYYYNGQPAYLVDGSLAYKITAPFITDNLEQHVGTPNHRVRYVEIKGGDTISVDVKTMKVSVNKIEAYSLDNSAAHESINGNATVFELSVPAYTRSDLTGYYPLIALAKSKESKTLTQDLIFAEASTGNLAVYYNEGFYPICDKDGNVLNIANDTSDIAIVYNDSNAKTRIFFNRATAYISKGDVIIPAVDVVINREFSEFSATEDYITLFTGYGADNVGIEVTSYVIDSCDTAKILGYQENGITEAIRLVAGLDTLYYEKTGFEIELFDGGESQGTKKFRNNLVFSRIIANDRDLSATVEGYDYFSVVNITDIPENISENSYLIVRSFTEIAGVTHYDSKVKISVTNDGYSFADFDDTDLYSKKQSVLLMGQSNMAGRGDVDDVLPISDSRITVLKNGKWEEMTEPIHNDKPEAGVGLAASFAKAFVETFDCELGLIPTAVGGSKLAQWSVGGDYYNNAVALAKKAQETSDICAILWHQGESDIGNYRYAAELNAILDSLIAELGLDKEKIVVITGELGEFIGEDRQLHSYSLVDAGYNYPNYGIASASGLTNMDAAHFDAPSQRVLGYRYFDLFYNITTGQNYSFDQDPSNYKISQTVITIGDTYVQRDNSTDKGSATLLQVKMDDTRTRRAFMKFDTTHLDAIDVSKATLRIKLDFFSKDANLSSLKIKLYAVSSEWDEGSFNWNTQPAIIEEITEVDATLFEGGYKWVKIDVTDYLKAHCGEIFTIAIYNEGAADGNGNLSFYSGESSGNEPKLVILGTEKDPNAPQPVKPATFVPAEDTYIQQNGTVDDGNNTFLQVKKDGTSYTRRAFMKFDTRGTDEGYVSKATLRIRLDWLSSDASVLPSFDINLYAVSSEWEESSFNWNNQPAVIEKIADVESSLFVGYQWVEIDVTDYVKDHYGEIFTIAMFNEGTDNASGNLKFYSSEHYDSRDVPQLVIS